jgi:hypothetical protein
MDTSSSNSAFDVGSAHAIVESFIRCGEAHFEALHPLVSAQARTGRSGVRQLQRERRRTGLCEPQTSVRSHQDVAFLKAGLMAA